MVKKILAWLHLWLGIGSGIVVVIISLTGCIYVFEHEIKSLYQPWKFVQEQNGAKLAPTTLIKSAEKHLKGKSATGVIYHRAGEAAQVTCFDRKAGIFTSVYVNPYTAEFLHLETFNRKAAEFEFFSFILHGHRALWLPYPIGRPIVGVAVLTFVFILLTGIVLWWPRRWNKANLNKSFKVKWEGKWKRVNYDLHNVLGFYSMIFLLFIALTGLVWSFQWFSKSAYWLTTAGKSLPKFRQPFSDSTNLAPFQAGVVDQIWYRLNGQSNEGIHLSIPKKPAEAIAATVYLRAGTHYKTDVYFYDQKTLMPLKGILPFGGKYAEASVGDKLRRMNYDIHVGSIFGIPGKIIAFTMSFLSASLPVTGFIIWWGKRKKGKKAKVEKVLDNFTNMPAVPVHKRTFKQPGVLVKK